MPYPVISLVHAVSIPINTIIVRANYVEEPPNNYSDIDPDGNLFGAASSQPQCAVEFASKRARVFMDRTPDLFSAEAECLG